MAGTGAWFDNSGYPWNPTGTGAPSAANGQRNDYSIPLPRGTAITSPVSGVVLPQHTSGGGLFSYYGSQPWGGEVDVLTSMPTYPGGLQVVDVLHFDTINVHPGDQVLAGQTVLGTSGGQTSGGSMPSSPQYSQGPHIGVGVHAVSSWAQMFNPSTLIDALRNGTAQSAVPTNNQIQAAGIGGIPIGGVVSPMAFPSPVGSITSPTDWLTALKSNFSGLFRWLSDPLRLLKLWLGVGVVATAVLLFAAGAFLPDIGAAVVTGMGIPEAAMPVQQALRGNKPAAGGGVIGAGRAGVRAAGAIEGQKTIKRKEAQAKAAEQEAEHQRKSASGRKGTPERRRRRAAGLPTKAEEQVARNKSRARAELAKPEAAPTPGTPEYDEFLRRRADDLRQQRQQRERRQRGFRGIDDTLRDLRGGGGGGGESNKP